MKSNEKNTASAAKKILSVCVRIFVILLILLVLAVSAFAVFFWDAFVVIVKNPSLIPYAVNNFDTFTRGFSISAGELESEQLANAEAQAKALEEADIVLTVEDIAGLEDENLTEEERAQIIYNAIVSGNKSENAESGDTPPVNQAPEENPVEENAGEDVKIPDIPQQNVTEKDKVKDKDKADEAGPEETGKPVTSVTEDKSGNKDSVPQSGNVTQVVIPDKTGNDKKEPLKTGKLTEEEYNMKVSELVAKIYSIKTDFVSKLSAFENKIVSQYRSLPEKERTTATKARIVSENMSYIMGLEAQCDAQVKAITDELSSLMKSNGKSTSLVDQINAAYANEKEIKKAYYVSLYK